jgi:hypothetical protein
MSSLFPCTKSLLQSLERTLRDSDCEKASYNFNALNNNNNNNNNCKEVPLPANVDNDWNLPFIAAVLFHLFAAKWD